MIAANAIPAAGFNDGSKYYQVDTFYTVLGKQGQVAFAGRTTAQDQIGWTNAVWSGFPGYISLLVKDGDKVEGLPDGTFFGFNNAFSSLSDTRLKISKSGDVAFLGHFSSVSGHIGPKIFAQHQGKLQAIKFDKVDSSAGAPGPTFTLSDAGLVVWGVHQTDAIWFWDHTSAKIIAETGMILPIYPDCKLQLIMLSTPQINDAGEIIFVTELTPRPHSISETIQCPKTAILRWYKGEFSTVADDDQYIPGSSSFKFALQTGSPTLNEAGGVTFKSYIKGATSATTWYKLLGQPAQLIAMGGEAVNSALPSVISNASALSVIVNDNAEVLALNKDSGNMSLLTGKPRSVMPYSDSLSPLANQLTPLASYNSLPPGLNGFHYEDFSYFELKSNGDVIFQSKIIKDDRTAQKPSVWLANQQQVTQKLIDVGQLLKINSQNYYFKNVLTGATLSSNRQLLFTANTADEPNKISGILLMSYD